MAGPTSKQVFASSPQQLCTTIDVTDEANQIRYHYSVQVRVTLGQQLHDQTSKFVCRAHPCRICKRLRACVQRWMKVGLPRTPLQHLHTLACIHSKLGEDRLDMFERSRIMIEIPVFATRMMPNCRTLQGGRRFPTTWSPSQRTSTSATSSAWRTSRYAACIHCLPAWPEYVLSTERSLLRELRNRLEHSSSSAAFRSCWQQANSALPLMVAAPPC